VRAPVIALLINAGLLYAVFSLYYWLVGPELSKWEAIGLIAAGAFVGQFFPMFPARFRIGR
jgi:hypothetical protein